MTKKFVVTLVAAAGMALAATSASAATPDVNIQVTGFEYAGPLTTYISSVSPAHATQHVYADGLKANFTSGSSGGSFVAYCADIFQSISFGSTQLTYQRASLSSVFGEAKADDFSLLANKFYSSVNNATTSAAFQIATWEILFEQAANPYKLSGDNFKAVNGSANPTALGTAQNWLDTLHSAPVTGNYQVNFLTNRNKQDLVFLTPVPEPETSAMLLSGLLLMGFMVRRRIS